MTDISMPNTFVTDADILASEVNANFAAVVTFLNSTGVTNYQSLSVPTAALAAGAVTTAKIADDAITGAKIADDQIDSEHYVDGSIDLAHLAADSVDGSKIADDSIDSEHYVDGSIDTAHIADDAVTPAKTSGFSKVKASRSTTQAVSDSTWTEVGFDVDDSDADAWHDTASNNGDFTVPSGKGGEYAVVATAQFATSGTGKRGLRLKVNDTVVRTSIIATTSGGNAYAQVVDVLTLAEADVLTVEALQDSGGGLNLVGGSNASTAISIQQIA